PHPTARRPRRSPMEKTRRSGFVPTPGALSGGGRRLTKLADFFQDDLVVGLLAQFVDGGVADNALLVDEEERALREPFLPQDAVFLGHLAMGIEIAEHRNARSTQGLHPG